MSRSRSISCIRLRSRYLVNSHSSLRSELFSMADLKEAYGTGCPTEGATFDGLYCCCWPDVGVARVRSMDVCVRKLVTIWAVASRSRTLMFVREPSSRNGSGLAVGLCTSVRLLTGGF